MISVFRKKCSFYVRKEVIKMKKNKTASKRILCAIVAFAAAASYIWPSGADRALLISAESTTQGDVNGDGSVTAADLVSFINYTLGREEGISTANADMNGDGRVNIIDCILLINSLSGQQEPEPPAADEKKTITLSDEGISITGTGAASEGSVVTITEPGEYSVTGKLSDGQIIVNVDKTLYPAGKVELSLEGVDITSLDNSPLYIASVDDECVITVKKGTENVITDGAQYTNADGDSGAVYSKDDLKFKGKGKLTVNGNCADGIVGKDSVKIFNGSITVNAADDGVRGKDSVKIGDADDTDFSSLVLDIKTGTGDGIKATNDTDEGKGKVIINGGTVNVRAFGDGIHAYSDVEVKGGTIDIFTYKGSSYQGGSTSAMPSDLSAKGIKSDGTINISGGRIIADTSDDAVHGASAVSVTGGVLELKTGDDGIHSDTDVTIGSGTADTYDDVFIYIPECYEGVEGNNVTQNSGTCIVYSTDDGYNAAGGADGSGMTGPGGWRPGGWGSQTSGGAYAINLNGGFVYVSTADGDHDGFDSNGALNIAGAIAVSNGNEAFDSDGTKSFTAGTFIELKGRSGGMGGGMGGAALTASFSASINAAAGDRITVSDSQGNVIVSFAAGKAATSCKVGSKTVSSGKVNVGGTVTGGTALPVTGDSQQVYTGGTVSGGTDGTAGSSSGSRW